MSIAADIAESLLSPCIASLALAMTVVAGTERHTCGHRECKRSDPGATRNPLDYVASVRRLHFFGTRQLKARRKPEAR
ncbi:MAG: hypothetical protein E6417_36710, partial [Bradyrhizobium sp.]|nr:hypothetical protein [Bradyrhizobium sp.]